MHAAIEALDLPGDPSDRLDPAVLVDRAGDRHALFDWDLREGREERDQLGCGGGVALDLVVGLLERERRSQGQGRLRAYVAARKPVQREDPFEWIGPDSSTSRSMLATPPRPTATRALTRVGRPNA